ncbi:1-(5-phosphoribosyl)-5-[(5-phosphoribosylamino)methylideneamino]imidazole-4-carboxamide isomerase [Albidovulum sp.]
MILYPTLEIKDGRCVSLGRGRIAEPTPWEVDPVEKAREFAAAGAEWMHLTDFDAVEGSERNEDLVLEIIRAAEIPVQLGGGMRSRARIEKWIERGAGRIVVGTLATQNPMLVKDLAKHHPDQIALAVDVREGRLMVEGWRTSAAISAEDLIDAFEGTPFAAVIVTDIDADLTQGEKSLALVTALARRTRLPVIASGIIRTLDDVSRLRLVGGISGALVGRALVNGTISLAEALREARPDTAHVAAFL